MSNLTTLTCGREKESNWGNSLLADYCEVKDEKNAPKGCRLISTSASHRDVSKHF